MDLFELSFAKIIIISDDISEVIVNEGVEMDTRMVDEYHNFLLAHLRAPFSLLVNKVNSYTYTFDAQCKLGTLDEINAMAVVAYNRISEESTKILATTVPRTKEWNLRIFSSRREALDWLISEQNKDQPGLANTVL